MALPRTVLDGMTMEPRSDLTPEERAELDRPTPRSLSVFNDSRRGMHLGEMLFNLRCPSGPYNEVTKVDSAHQLVQTFFKGTMRRDEADDMALECYMYLLNHGCYVIRRHPDDYAELVRRGATPKQLEDYLSGKEYAL